MRPSVEIDIVFAKKKNAQLLIENLKRYETNDD